MANDSWNNGELKTSGNYFNDSNLLDMETQSKCLLFDDHCIRKNFIRKVYLILMSQLLMTFAIVAIFLFNETLRAFVVQNPVIFWPGFIVLLVTMLIMTCCDELRRQTPVNYIFLAIFTLAQSFLLAIVTCQFAAVEILLAVGTTAAICLALSLYAFQTKYDFTMMGGVLLMSLVVFLIFGLFTIFFPIRPLLLLHSSLGAVLFSIYMIYDTQLMMGGRHKYSLSPEEYVFAALNLYLDVINIFLYILSLLTSGRS
ncbi:protein lifeguard 1-like [Calliphora vicina]|uniref:protein lifeguard 1-like n=1 Tax=Calliphora vicina TaxID=7373 RepID=UPI00325BA108